MVRIGLIVERNGVVGKDCAAGEGNGLIVDHYRLSIITSRTRPYSRTHTHTSGLVSVGEIKVYLSFLRARAELKTIARLA